MEGNTKRQNDMSDLKHIRNGAHSVVVSTPTSTSKD